LRLGETLIFLGIPKNPIYLSGESVEEYLEAIYKINEEGRPAKNSELTKNLKVSPPSVTQMVQKLSDEGLVVYEPYKGIYLTGKGASLAQKVVRRHRLLEVFLHDVLKLPREKVHDPGKRSTTRPAAWSTPSTRRPHKPSAASWATQISVWMGMRSPTAAWRLKAVKTVSRRRLEACGRS